MMLNGQIWRAVFLWIISAILVSVALYLHAVRSERFVRFAKNPLPWFVVTVFLFLTLSNWPFLNAFLPAVPSSELVAAREQLTKVESLRDELQAKLNAALRERDAALKARDAAQSPTGPTTGPTTYPEQVLSAEDRAINVGVWQNIAQQLNELSRILNRGYTIVDTWLPDMQTNRAEELKKVQDLATAVSALRIKLDRLRASYFNYADIAEALKETSIPAGRPQVPGSIFDRLIRSTDGFGQELASPADPIPQDVESTMMSQVGALKRDLNAMREWQTAIQRVTSSKVDQAK
jgi:hypothetical protein